MNKDKHGPYISDIIIIVIRDDNQLKYKPAAIIIARRIKVITINTSKAKYIN